MSDGAIKLIGMSRCANESLVVLTRSLADARVATRWLFAQRIARPQSQRLQVRRVQPAAWAKARSSTLCQLATDCLPPSLGRPVQAEAVGLRLDF